MGCDHDHNHGHGGHDHEEEYEELSVQLEKDQVEKLQELAGEYKKMLGQDWDLSAMVRVAVGDFLNKMGKIT
ncbi:MAG: hypothetical protein HYS21_06740 [Deltaproteobacteria bacterium]|nr:hypothetical protein [Deltaproteobacteria bacterium]